MVDRPTYLHVPVLYEMRPTLIYWNVVDGAYGYRVERVLLDKDGNMVQEVVYDGLGMAVDEGASGYRWAILNALDNTWEELENYNNAWGEFERIVVLERGLSWLELGGYYSDWAGLERYDKSWGDFEQVIVYGLAWHELESYYLNWNDINGRDDTWRELEQLLNTDLFVGFVDKIPYGHKYAAYRIRAYNATGFSEYFSTDWLPITTYFTKSDEIELTVTAGFNYFVQLVGEGIQRFGDVQMTVQYNPSELQLVDFAAQTPESDLEEGEVPNTDLHIDSIAGGQILFKNHRPIEEGTEWSGLITLLEFMALANGTTTVTLS